MTNVDIPNAFLQSEDAVEMALQMDGKVFMHRQLRVQRCAKQVRRETSLSCLPRCDIVLQRNKRADQNALLNYKQYCMREVLLQRLDFLTFNQNQNKQFCFFLCEKGKTSQGQ